MEELKNWCMGLCCAAVFCSAVLLSAPEKRVASMMKFLCGILLCAAFILPFAGMAGDLIDFDGLDFSKVSYNSSYDGYVSGLEFMILGRLKNAGFEPSEVRVSKEGDKTVATVYLPSKMKGAAFSIRAAVYDEFGLDTEFVFTE